MYICDKKGMNMIVYDENTRKSEEVPDAVVVRDYYIIGGLPDYDTLLDYRLGVRRGIEGVVQEVLDREILGIDWLLRKWSDRVQI